MHSAPSVPRPRPNKSLIRVPTPFPQWRVPFTVSLSQLLTLLSMFSQCWLTQGPLVICLAKQHWTDWIFPHNLYNTLCIYTINGGSIGDCTVGLSSSSSKSACCTRSTNRFWSLLPQKTQSSWGSLGCALLTHRSPELIRKSLGGHLIASVTNSKHVSSCVLQS